MSDEGVDMMRGDGRFTKRMLGVLMLSMSACVTIVGDNRPAAVDMTLSRARFDLECPRAEASVLSEEVVRGTPADSSRHTIGVSGCGRQATYVADCTDEKDCTVVRQTGAALEFAPEVVP